MNRIAVLFALGVLASALAGVLATPAMADDFASVARRVILYDNTSTAANKVAIVKSGTPVELIIGRPGENWVKVRSPAGHLGWLEGQTLSTRRNVLVSSSVARIRQQPDETSPVVFEAIHNVILELISVDPSGWIQVRHADGSEGYMRTVEAWGI